MFYGWDISTSIIGLAVFDDDGNFIEAHHCDLRDHEHYLDKADHFSNWLKTVIQCDGGKHFIEDRLGNFSAGKTMMQTLMKLAAFNALCSWIIRSTTSGDVQHIHPSTWKAVLKHDGLFIPKGTKPDEKKKITLKYVKNKLGDKFPIDLNRNDNPHPWNFDRADAYCLGRAGILKRAEGKKASGSKGSTG